MTEKPPTTPLIRPDVEIPWRRLIAISAYMGRSSCLYLSILPDGVFISIHMTTSSAKGEQFLCGVMDLGESELRRTRDYLTWLLGEGEEPTNASGLEEAS